MDSVSAFRAALVLRLFVLATFASAAAAADFYVDVVHGNDANAGSSPATAWRTITYASTVTPSGPTTTIHLAPGVYDATSGEVFPLVFHSQRLVGDQGPRTTFVDGGGTSAVLIRMISASGSGSTQTEVRGLTLRNAASALDARTTLGPVGVSLVDLLVSGMTAAAFHGDANYAPNGFGVHLGLTRVHVTSSAQGAVLTSVTDSSGFTATDCSFDTCSADAIQLAPSSASMMAAFTRCRFGHGAAAAVRGSAIGTGATPAHLDVTFDDCLLWSNGSGFSDVQASGSNGFVTATFRRCTIANNIGAGIEATNAGSTGMVSVALNSTLVWGNGTDLDATNLTSTAFSQIGGPDPRFISPGLDDYRVGFLSPCVDAGDPSIPSGTLDLAGVPRSIDGNMDTIERADIGALEFQPISILASGHIGTLIYFQLWGGNGRRMTIYYSRLAPVSPSNTPFGQVDLDPASIAHLIGPIGVGTDGSSTAAFLIPSDPLLVGRTFSFQGLTESRLAPQGFAYTNVVSVTITP